MNWVLIIVIAIFVFFGWLGWKKGFIKLLFSLISTVVALIFAVLFSPVTETILKSNQSFVSFIDEKIESLIDFSTEDADADGHRQETLIEGLPLPKSFKEALHEDNTVQKYTELGVQDFKEYVCRRITNMIINAIAFVITLAFAIIALAVVCGVLNLLAKLPLLHQINEIAGLAAGLAQGLLVVWILFVILTMLGANEVGQNALAMIGENPILDFLYKNNLISGFIMRK